MSKMNSVNEITLETGKSWGAICLIPFGWMFFLASIIRRKNDVMKYGVLDARLALYVLHNYIVGYTIITVAVMVCVFSSWSEGEFVVLSIIEIIITVVVYNIAVDRILKYVEKAQSNTLVNEKDL